MAAAASVVHHQMKKQGSMKDTSPKHPGQRHESLRNKVFPDDDQDAATRGITFFQRMIRKKIVCPHRLNRSNLAERVRFESDMVIGTIRLLNQLTVFALLMLALRMSSNEPRKFGIFKDLDAIYDFAGLESARSPQQFVEKLGEVSSASKQFFHLSSHYFDSGGRGAVQLLGDMEAFTGHKVVDQLELQQYEFSFTAWVETTPQFLEGYIVRKRPTSTGPGAALSCFSWYLHRNLGQMIKYGAHDFDPQAGPYDDSSSTQLEVGVASPRVFPSGTVVMLTVVVRQTNVTFYHNLEELGTFDLPRASITDCHNEGEGLLLGDTSMSLGVVRYFPHPLGTSTIEELFSAGSRLSDISRGSEPAVSSATQIDSLEKSISTGIEGLNEAVTDRQSLSELNSILKAVQEQDATAGSSTTKSPVAPLGAIDVNHTLVDDSVVNRQYYSLLKGPYWLTETTAAADHRYLRNPPNFANKGVLLAFWYRHVACAVENCGIWLWAAKTDASDNHCWSLWWEDHAFYYDNPVGNPGFQYPRDFTPDKYNLNGDQTWRHLAVLFDDATDTVKYYMDGVMAWSGPWGSDVAGADCLGTNRRITVGRVEPGWTYGNTAEVFDFRMYPDPTGQGALTDADILALARAPTPEISDESKCFPIEAKAMEDTDWLDTYEHSCKWYFQARQDFPQVCNYGAASSACPSSCKSKQECFKLPESTPAYFTWDRIRKIERRSSNGTICLREGIDKAQVVQGCRNWMAGEPDVTSLPWYESFMSAYSAHSETLKMDFRDCDMLEAAIDTDCAFNSEAVYNFTKESQANDGQWTIGFWIKPVGISSFHTALNRFFPHVSFLATLSPPTKPVEVGVFNNPNGEFRVMSSCDRASRDAWENVEMNAASNDGWTFLAITYRNGTGSETSVATNLGKDAEGSTIVQCPFDEDYFFNHLEINYPALISPIMMIPKALPFALTQELYLRQTGAMEVKNGPRVAQAEMIAEAAIDISKTDFTPRSVLVAPPILFQIRHSLSNSCSVNYAGQFIQEEHQKVLGSLCAEPYVCSDEVMKTAASVIGCPGDRVENGTAFGLKVSEFDGENGFADFLFSWQDNPFLFREGRVTHTSEFIDSMTSRVQVILVFFTPRYGMTSVLTVTGYFDRFGTTETEVQLQHFEVIEGGDLTIYLVLQIIVLFNIAIMLIDICLSVRRLVIHAYQDGEFPAVTAVFKQLVDLATAISVVVFVASRIPTKSGSASKTEEIVGGLTQLQWDSQEITLSDKTTQFFDLLNELMSTIGTESAQNTFCVFILFVNLVRVIQCTALHPRLALLTGTLVKATDDLWHAILLVFLLMGCFAGIATWRFGSERAEFTTFGASMNMQFMMLFGEFPPEWEMNYEMIFYTFAYFIILFLLVQNFLLAIIVEAYMQVRTDNETMETEQEFVHDVYHCFNSHWQALRRGWPTLRLLGEELDDWSCKISVGFTDLWDTRLFKNQDSVVEFINYYRKFDFLEPPVVKAYGLDNGSQDLPSEIERRLAKLFIGHVPTLKEMADENIKAAKLRKASKLGASKAGLDGSTHGLDHKADESPVAESKGNGDQNGKDSEGQDSSLQPIRHEGSLDRVQQWNTKASSPGILNQMHINASDSFKHGPSLQAAVAGLSAQLEEQKEALAAHNKTVDDKLSAHFARIEKLISGKSAAPTATASSGGSTPAAAEGSNPSGSEGSKIKSDLDDILDTIEAPQNSSRS